MYRVNNRMDLYLRGNKKSRAVNNQCRRSRFVGGSVRCRYNIVLIIITGISLLLSAGSAFGQFAVQPMRIELAAVAGRVVRQAVEIRNYDPNEIHSVDFTVVELSQYEEDGSWMIIEPDSGFNISTLSSCSKWINITPTSGNIDPSSSITVMVDVKIPRGVRGFYAAGVLATIKPRPNESDIAVGVRFLIPVLIGIQGRTPPQRVDLEGVDLIFSPTIGSRPSTTYVSMNIKNNGGTYSRLKPLTRIWQLTDGHWRLITTSEFSKTSIIPGIGLKLRQALPNSLPSGRYKIVGALYVDGRIAGRIQNEIDFVGDATVARVASDAPIDLIPVDVVVESIPGATRLSSIKIINASTEPVHIQTATGLPPELQGVDLPDLKGEDLDCTKWISIQPQNFTIPSNGQQSLTITSSMPNMAAMHPCYYSLIALWATYPDGQKAGVSRANICLTNTQIEAKPQVDAINVIPAHLSGSEYIISAKFVNFGSVHVNPIKCRAIVDTDMGVGRASAMLTCDKPGFMLPLEARVYSGVLNFTNVEAGTYRLTSGLFYNTDGLPATKQITIRVSIEGEERLVEVVRTENEIPNTVEVQW